jgi:hypothetical protein
MRVTILTPLYALAIASLLGLTGCGGTSQPAPAAPPASPACLHTGRILLVGGNALVDYDALTKSVVPKYFGPCVDNEGRFNGNSTTTLGVFQLGVLNAYPSRVVIVVDEFETLHGDREQALDNYTGAIVTAVASGARTSIVGVPGQPVFNSWLRGLALAYGAEYADTLAVTCS